MICLTNNLSVLVVMVSCFLTEVNGQEPLTDPLSRLRRLGAHEWVKDSVRYLSLNDLHSSATHNPWEGAQSDLNLLTQIGDVDTLILDFNFRQLGFFDFLPQIGGLSELSIHGARVTPELMHNISQCKLKRLTLRGWYEWTTKELQPIIEMRNLEGLSLHGVHMKDGVFLSLADMGSLRELRVVSFDFTQTGFDYVTQIKTLEKVHFAFVKLDDESLTNLLRLPKLREFSFLPSMVTDSGKKWMRENLPNCTLVEEGKQAK